MSETNVFSLNLSHWKRFRLITDGDGATQPFWTQPGELVQPNQSELGDGPSQTSLDWDNDGEQRQKTRSEVGTQGNIGSGLGTVRRQQQV